jgi:hypothetical protein
MKKMKKIKVILEVILDIPEKMELGVDVNDIPYYFIATDGMARPLELHPNLGFDVSYEKEMARPSDEGCEVLEVNTKIEELNG